jgi:hypothetical protein
MFADRELLAGVGLLAVRGVQRGIREQRSPNGKPYPKTTRFGRPAQRLQDTKRLLNSISFDITGRSRVTVGTNVVYAEIQHKGGTIRPKRGKRLAIPLTRQAARAAAGRGFRAAYPDAFTFTSRKGNLLLARRRSKRKNSRLELLALLVEKSTIRGTGFLGASRRTETEIRSFLFSYAKKKAAAGGRRRGR